MFYIAVLESPTYFMSVTYNKNKYIRLKGAVENSFFYLEN